MASGDKFYIADKVTLDEVNGKIGTTTDAGGSEIGGTGFAKLNKIIHDVVDTIRKIGNTDDVSGTSSVGSVMGKLNSLLNYIGGGQAIFNMAGQYTFTVPSGITKIRVTACAAGGGGGGSAFLNGTTKTYWTGGGGGGGGECVTDMEFTVNPGEIMNVTVGAGGLGAAENLIATTSAGGTALDGSAGGSTIIGNLLTLSGGKSGKGGYVPREISYSSDKGGLGGAAGGTGGTAGVAGGCVNRQPSQAGTNKEWFSSNGGATGGSGGTSLIGKDNMEQYGNGGRGGTYDAMSYPTTDHLINAKNGIDGYVLIKWGA